MLLLNGSTSGCSSKAPCCSRRSSSSACSSGTSSRRHVLPPPPAQQQHHHHHHHHNSLATRWGWRSSPACAALRQEEEIEYPTELSRVDGAQNSEADEVEDAKAREFAIACAEVVDQTKWVPALCGVWGAGVGHGGGVCVLAHARICTRPVVPPPRAHAPAYAACARLGGFHRGAAASDTSHVCVLACGCRPHTPRTTPTPPCTPAGAKTWWSCMFPPSSPGAPT